MIWDVLRKDLKFNASQFSAVFKSLCSTGWFINVSNNLKGEADIILLFRYFNVRPKSLTFSFLSF